MVSHFSRPTFPVRECLGTLMPTRRGAIRVQVADCRGVGELFGSFEVSRREPARGVTFSCAFGRGVVRTLTLAFLSTATIGVMPALADGGRGGGGPGATGGVGNPTGAGG